MGFQQGCSFFISVRSFAYFRFNECSKLCTWWFICVGAFTGVWLFNMTGSYVLALIGAIAMGMFLGFILERFLIRPVYGNHVRQLLVTLGGMLVLSECIKVFWGPNQLGQSYRYGYKEVLHSEALY